MRIRPVRTAIALALVLASAWAAVPASAADDDDGHLPWTDVLPPLPAQHADTVEELCPDGQLRCVDLAINRMRSRLAPQAAHCDHDAVFSLLYLRTTEAFRVATTTDGFFRDPAFMNHWATVFADYYFRAFDAHAAGNTSAVPPAWRIALDAADDGAVTGTGNMLLAMNAHINRDLPFVLANIGLVAPDGRSRKPDHDAVNRFLRGVLDPARAESADRFDPTMAPAVDSYLADTTLFQVIAAWREEAWRQAEVLRTTPTLLRPVVAAAIETEAATTATAIRAATTATPAMRAERDAYCATR